MTQIRFERKEQNKKEQTTLFCFISREKIADILFNGHFDIVVYYSIFSLDYINSYELFMGCHYINIVTIVTAYIYNLNTIA